ncbi:MAG: hypothetical protein ABIH23_16815 [bacterium]
MNEQIGSWVLIHETHPAAQHARAGFFLIRRENTKMELKVPKILNTVPVGLRSMVATTVGTTSAAIGIGSWVDEDSGLLASASGETNAKYVVMGIYKADGERMQQQYLTAAQILATAYLLEVIPIGGLIFEMTEDGLVTPITDANSGIGAAVYCDLVVTAPTEPPETSLGLPGRGIPTIQIDSDTVNAASTGLLCQLLGLSGNIDNPAYSATAAENKRNFLVKVIDAVAQADQDAN